MWIILRGVRSFWISFAAAAILVAAAGGLYLYGIFSIARDWTFLSGARADLASTELARRNLGVAERELAALAPELGAIEASFADPKNPLPFIEAVEALGRRLGVKAELTLASSASASQADAYLIAVSGSFPRAAMFLKLFEAFPFLVTFGDAEITRTGVITETEHPSSDQVRLSLAVKILTFR